MSEILPLHLVHGRRKELGRQLIRANASQHETPPFGGFLLAATLPRDTPFRASAAGAILGA